MKYLIFSVAALAVCIGISAGITTIVCIIAAGRASRRDDEERRTWKN